MHPEPRGYVAQLLGGWSLTVSAFGGETIVWLTNNALDTGFYEMVIDSDVLMDSTEHLGYVATVYHEGIEAPHLCSSIRLDSACLFMSGNRRVVGSIALGRPAMREHRSQSGKLIYFASRAELEGLKGYRGNNQQGRACCPIHDGDNPTALTINWVTGWANCWSCRDAWSIRVEDHPDAMPGVTPYPAPIRAPLDPPQRASRRRTDQPPVEHDVDAIRMKLDLAIAQAVERLPTSPGAAYLERRGISLDIACELGIGWGAVGSLAGRVVFPLCDPAGWCTSAIARRIYETDNPRDPKYKALKADDGYVKTLFNGGAIVQAKRSGHPLIVVEGPLDAAACIMADLPLTVALCGSAYAHPEHFAGLSTVILALDNDDAGQEGRRRLWLELMGRGVEVLILPATALDGCKDLGEYWQRHRTMPMQLLARVLGPHLAGGRIG